MDALVSVRSVIGHLESYPGTSQRVHNRRKGGQENHFDFPS